MASNPTPRAYLRVLSQNNKSEKAKKCISRDDLHRTITNIPLTMDNHSRKIEKSEKEHLRDKINLITTNCSKAYFRKALISLGNTNSKNASIICDYLIAEEYRFFLLVMSPGNVKRVSSLVQI
jgi:hypothetical protein